MRGSWRRPTGEEADHSYLASVSDLMSGLIFLFIITLMVFAFSYKKYERDLTNTEVIRAELLQDLHKSLERHGIQVQVDLENGVLRLPEEILFPLGSADLSAKGRNAVAVLASELSRVVPCYAGEEDRDRPPECPGEHWHPGRLDTILVEGHTDDIPVKGGGRYGDNWDLSSARAITTYKALLEPKDEGLGAEGELDELRTVRNRRGEPIFGVSGYAEYRPASGNLDDQTRARNRRIDLRFVMTPPRVTGSPLQGAVAIFFQSGPSSR